MGLSRYLWNIFAFCGENLNSKNTSVTASSSVGVFNSFVLILSLSYCYSSEANAIIAVTASPTAISANSGANVLDLSIYIQALLPTGVAPFTINPTTATASICPTCLSSAGSPVSSITYTPTTDSVTTETVTFDVTDSSGTTISTNGLTLSITIHPVVPTAPTIGTATTTPSLTYVATTTASVPFTANLPTGGAATTLYTATAYAAGVATTFTGTNTVTPITVSGLKVGTAYTFKVTATNSAGVSLPSAASNSVTPTSVPSTPTSVTATSGNGLVSIKFTTPATGGLALLASTSGYLITPYVAGVAQTAVAPTSVSTSGSSTTLTLSGLTNGTAYTSFAIQAKNINGSGAISAKSNSVTIGLNTTITSVTPIAGDGQVSVVFATSNTGASQILSYTVTPYIGTVPQTPVVGYSSPIDVTGLTNGTAYTFTVTASTSTLSTTSNATATYTPAPTGIAQNVAIKANTATTITLGSSSPAPANLYTLVVTPASPTAHGTYTLNGNVVTYTPTQNYYGTDTLQYYFKTAATLTNFPSPRTITIGSTPLAGAATMSVLANTPKQFDLSPFITGTGVTGVSITTQPTHGVVSTIGTTWIIYKPSANYRGNDSFSYAAYVGSSGASVSPGTVTVTVGLGDPSQDTRVTGIINNQTNATVHFATAQVLNFQQRLESRHQAMNMPVLLPIDSGSIQRTTKLPTASPTNTATPAIAIQDTNTPSIPVPTVPSGSPNDNGELNKQTAPDTPTTPEIAPPVGGAAAGQLRSYFNNWQPNTVLNYSNDPNRLIHQLDDPTGKNTKDDAFATLMQIVSDAVVNSTLNLSSVSNAFNNSKKDPNQIDIWASGNLRIGTSTSAGTTTQFKTDGISVGEDKRINRNWIIGIGFGYAVDNSTVGTDGTTSRSTGDSVTLYSSYQWNSGTFVDTLLGYGLMFHDTSRFDPNSNSFATARRKGNQWFGSISFGYDYDKNGLLLSPYGRYDFSFDKLNAGTEVGTNALSYAIQNSRSSSLSIGFLGQSSHQTDFGVVQPHARVEFQRGIEAVGSTSVAYADVMTTQYSIAGTSQNSYSILMGLGSNFLFNDSWSLGVDYSRLTSNGPENYQSINFLLTKTFNEQNAFNWLIQNSTDNTAKKPTGIIASGTVTYDDNVSRATNGPDKLFDTVYTFSASDTFTKILSKRHLISLEAFADSYTYQSYTGLNELSAGLQAEYSYAADAEFGTPTYGVFARGAFDNYNSDIRNGTHHSFGVNIHKTLTDSINFYSAITDNSRAGNSAVFTTHDDSVLINFDYYIDNNQNDKTIYLTGEYRKGDVVSSGKESLQKVEISSWFNNDDAFSSAGLVAYRLKAVTSLYTLGYNISFGPKDSIDISWRRVISTPDLKPVTGQAEKYFDNQYSLSYLLAF